jgi:hypothetical protein
MNKVTNPGFGGGVGHGGRRGGDRDAPTVSPMWLKALWDRLTGQMVPNRSRSHPYQGTGV